VALTAIPQPYANGFQDPDELCLSYTRFGDGSGSLALTRADFARLSGRAASLLAKHECHHGTRILHCFGDNDWMDPVFRMGAAMLGAIPVAINWQADSLEQIVYKFEKPRASAIVFNESFDTELRANLISRLGTAVCIDTREILEETELPQPEGYRTVPGDTRLIVFTSGTTGNPKGVMLTWENYAANAAALEDMLAIRPEDPLDLVVVNPLHHTNSSAITDWGLRRANTRIHLFSRYSTPWWKALQEIADMAPGRVVAPVVARHFDFLEELAGSGRLGTDPADLAESFSKIDFLIGSAPVGPTTVERVQRLTGRLPVVRFGSTETCLQVLGTPVALAPGHRLRIFADGWEHRRNDVPETGYWIGREHPGLTECRIVRAIDPGQPGFMEDLPDGVPGYLVTRGRNLMKGYVNDDARTAAVFKDGWYLGLEDICFALTDPADGSRNFYWMSRDSALIIRGGSNYSCEQINEELRTWTVARYGLHPDEFILASAGIKIGSEHEDACCVTIELLTDHARSLQDEIQGSFIPESRAQVSKGAKPDRLRFAPVPVNFKGAILLAELKKAWENNRD